MPPMSHSVGAVRIINTTLMIQDCSGVMPDCHDMIGSGYPSLTSSAFVLVELTDSSVCGGTVVSTKVVIPEGLVSLHLHPCCMRIFKLNGMDYRRTPLETSTTQFRDV